MFNNWKRYTICILLLVFIIGPVIAGGTRTSGTDNPTVMVIGYQAIPNGALVAKNLGWHEERLGIPIRWVEFNSGSELNGAIASGSVDLGLGGSSTTVAAIAQGVPGKVFWIYNIIGENEALVVRSTSGIRTMADLVGKRIAAPFGATTHYHLMVALELAGIDPESLTIFDMPPADMRAAWIRGDIDGAFVWEPTLAALLDLDGEVLISSGELAAQGYLTGDIGLVGTGFAEKYPHLVQGYLESQIRGVGYIRSNPELASQAIARELGIDSSEALRQMNSLVFLDGTQQLSREFMGTSQSPGELAEIFLATGQFLAEQQRIRTVPSLRDFQSAIAPEFLEAAVEARK